MTETSAYNIDTHDSIRRSENKKIVQVESESLIELKDLRDTTIDEEGFAGVHQEMIKFRISVNSRYITVCSRSGQTRDAWCYSFCVYDLISNEKLNEFSLKPFHEGKHPIIDIEAHTLVDNLVLIHDKGGWIKMIDIV